MGDAKMLDMKPILDRFSVTLEQLAERADISPERVTQLLSGEDASLGELRRIASALKTSISDLVPQGEIYKQANLMFRRYVPKENIIDDRSIHHISQKIENSFHLIGEVRSRNKWSEYFKIEVEDYETADALSERFREIFFDGDLVGPLIELPEIVVRDMDVLLFVLNLPHIDGASAYIDGQPFVFVSSRFRPRMLFTLAHEVGHLLAHQADEGGFAILDWLEDCDPPSHKGNLAEAFANTFASCLLLPAAGVGVALKKIREIATVEHDKVGDIELLYLSRIFGTSFESAARRCEDLKLLPQGGAHALYREVRRKFGSPEKRAELLKLPQRPEIDFPIIPDRLLVSAIHKIKSGSVSIGKASAILGISISDILAAHAQAQN